jgi:tetratricopeptide (TPR) repeat protein
MADEEKSGSAADEPPRQPPPEDAGAPPARPPAQSEAEQPNRAPAGAAEPEPAPADVEDGQASLPLDKAALRQMMPEKVPAVPFPLFGLRFPMRVYVGMLLVVLVASGSVLLSLGRGTRKDRPPRPHPDTMDQLYEPPEVPESWRALPYAELLAMAEARTALKDHLAAARLYRAASNRESEGQAAVAFARFRLAQTLIRLEQYEEALRMCEELSAESRPGDQLWKHTMVTSITILNRMGRWREFWMHVSRLQANTHHYVRQQPPDPDMGGLNAWLAYCKAVARMKGFISAWGQETIYDVELPPYGRLPSGCAPLDPEQITLHAPQPHTPELRVEPSLNSLLIHAERAPLREVIEVLGKWGEITVRHGAESDQVITCHMNVMSPEDALDVVLGSVGLQADIVGEVAVVRQLDLATDSVENARKAAEDAMHRLLLYYGESDYLGEAHFALAHLYVTRRQPDGTLSNHWARTAMDQPANMPQRFRRTLWETYSRYVAGRAALEIGEPVRAAEELLRAHDSLSDHPLMLPSMRYAGEAQMAQGDYTSAGRSFAACLMLGADRDLRRRLQYLIAYCAEKSGVPELEVARDYLEIRSRYPGSEEARLADYRRARMAYDLGQWGSAAARYAFYLTNVPRIDDDVTRDACAELAQCYAHLGDCYRVYLLGEIMSATMMDTPQFREALPLLLDAYRETEMSHRGIQVIDSARKQSRDPNVRWQLGLTKARFLLGLERYDEVQSIMEELAAQAADQEQTHYAWLLRARVYFARDDAEQGIALCRAVATAQDGSEQTRAEALRTIGSYYESIGEFRKAALAYSGQCPVSVEGGQS